MEILNNLKVRCLWVLNNLKIFLFLILILTILFPFAQAFTHNISLALGDLFETFGSRLKTIDVKHALTSLNYDAWSNFMASIKYSEIESITYGRQLAGAVLFLFLGRFGLISLLAQGTLLQKIC